MTPLLACASLGPVYLESQMLNGNGAQPRLNTGDHRFAGGEQSRQTVESMPPSVDL